VHAIVSQPRLLADDGDGEPTIAITFTKILDEAMSHESVSDDDDPRSCCCFRHAHGSFPAGFWLEADCFRARLCAKLGGNSSNSHAFPQLAFLAKKPPRGAEPSNMFVERSTFLSKHTRVMALCFAPFREIPCCVGLATLLHERRTCHPSRSIRS
jgi:hypothetical protein